MFEKIIPISLIVISALLCACDKQSHEHLGEANHGEANQIEPKQLVIKITEDANPLKGTQLSYSQETFLIEAEPSLEFSPDQGPILFNHIELSPRVFVGPITDKIDKNYPLKLTLPIEMHDNMERGNLYVLGWGDDGWVRFDSVSQTKKSVTIEITEILYDPFVAVIDK